MPQTTSDIVIRISGKIDDFDKKLDSSQKKVEAFSDASERVAKVGAVALAAFTAEIALSTKAYAESEGAARRLSTTLQNQGVYTAELVDQYKKVSSAIQAKTGIDDDEITNVQSVIQGYLGQTEATEDLIGAIADLSVEKKLDLEATAQLIGKGINGHTAALKKLGIEIDEHLSKEERTAQIIQKVNAQFGGQAAAANEGLGGIKGLTSAFGSLQEAIGARFAPVISAVYKSLTEFFQAASENESLVSLASAVIAGGAALSGMVALLGTAGVALSGATALATAFGVSLAVALGPIGVVTAAVVALSAAIGYYITTTQKGLDLKGKSAAELATQLDELLKKEKALSESKPGPFYDGFKEAEKASALRKVREEIKQVQAAQTELDKVSVKKKVADDSAADLAESEGRKLAALRASNELMQLEAEQASKSQIQLKQQEVALLKQIEDDKNVSVRDALIARLEDVRLLQEQAQTTEFEQKRAFEEQLLASNEEFEALSDEQKQVFLLKNQQGFQEQLLTEQQVRANAAATRAKKQIEDNNQFLENERKYGLAYAEIHKAMNSEVVQGTASAAGELVQLQTSNNATLKAIGKAAAVADITIKTAQSAMNIYAGFSALGPWGIPLGIAGAAAAVAFGAEQVGRVTGAADGGILTGGMPGVDSIPVLGMPGELVAPTRNFDEVIGSVRAAREAERLGVPFGMGASQSSEDGFARVEIGWGGGPSDSFMEMFELRLIERRRIGVSLIPGGAY